MQKKQNKQSNKRIYFFIAFTACFLSCTSSKKTQEDTTYKRPADYIMPTKFMDMNPIRSPFISSGGENFLFVYHKPNAHSPQIFEGSISRPEEKRQITHQAGSILSVSYMPNDSILYTSTTDEDKENPAFLRSFLYPDQQNEDELGLEIYVSSIQGSNIQRLTRRPGFDGHPDYLGKTNDIIYSSKRGPYHSLYIKNLRTQNEKVFFNGRWNDKHPKISPNENQLAWIRERDGAYSIVVKSMNDKSDPIENELPFKEMQDLNWHPDSEWLIFSGKENEGLSIYAFHISTKCMMQLSFHPEDDFEPVFHPNGKDWYFISKRDGYSKLYRNYYWPLASCEQQKTSGEAN